MGFLSDLFKKKEKLQIEVKTSHIEKTRIISDDPNIPPFQGDYAKTVFLWAHSKASPVKANDGYARYFLYECGIRNAARYHQELIATGYFEEASVAQTLNSLKVTELKEILEELGQPTTGKKEGLIDRIAKYANDAIISRYCPEKQYILSTYGQDFLDAHYDYVMVHKHKNWGVDWKEYDAHKIPGVSYYDTMWAIFNEQLTNNLRSFGRNQYLYMYQLLHEEGKREQALQMLLRVLYIDLSGVEGMQYYDLYRQGIYNQKEVRECFNIAIMLAPGILDSIKDFADIYKDEIVSKIYEQRLPVQVCDKKLFIEIISSTIDGTYDQSTAEEKLKKAYYKYLREALFV